VIRITRIDVWHPDSIFFDGYRETAKDHKRNLVFNVLSVGFLGMKLKIARFVEMPGGYAVVKADIQLEVGIQSGLLSRWVGIQEAET
jgi:hypothetical protein